MKDFPMTRKTSPFQDLSFELWGKESLQSCRMLYQTKNLAFHNATEQEAT
jgi:hypothetical protein